MQDNYPHHIAHISEDGSRVESVLQHLVEVAEMASEFAEPFGVADWAYAAGMLHDIGKYSEEFQKRIRGSELKVDHSTAGAYVAKQARLSPLSYCIAGHHGGLPDGGARGDTETTLAGRLYKAEHRLIPAFESYACEVVVPPIVSEPFHVDLTRLSDNNYAKSVNFSRSFFIRMLFSCLVDADYLCTERFMLGEGRASPTTTSLVQMRDMLEQKLSGFYPPQTYINSVRCRVLDDCLTAAAMEPGVFSLTVPTGGGKTYALIRFALHHATQPGREFRRIICAEPYTSIIEQNAEVYRQVFGDTQVLEHHSNYEFADYRDDDRRQSDPMRLAAENWDVPLVVTTNVQLFESLFANKTSRCRKLHNVAHSVIVLDEAQMIPTKYLVPCVRALAELVRNYGCTIVLCTATQPALNPYFELEGLTTHEIASDPKRLANELQRVRYQMLGMMSDEELVDKLYACDQSLCVVNSRKQARVLYDLVVNKLSNERRPVFHLTTLMYPRHRSEVIRHINALVRAGKPCTVIATSLVEAGVDLDFGTVFRAVSGVDSMVQAAGRCNREMTRPVDKSFVYLFETKESYALPAEVSQRCAVTRGVLTALSDSDQFIGLDEPDAIQEYFERLYAVKGRGLDDKNIVAQLSEYGKSAGIPSIPFARVAAQFQLVEDSSFAVIVPTQSNAADIELLREKRATRATMRRLGRYGVGVYKADRDALFDAGAIERVGENVFLLIDEQRYRQDVGLDLYVRGGEAVFL